MRFSHVVALGWLACFAVACGQGEPADPQQDVIPAASSKASSGSGSGAATRGPAGAPDVTTPAPNGAPSSASPSGSGSPSSAPAPLPLTEQGAAGQQLFQDHCTGCHGTSVSVSSFGTAADVATFMSTNMPLGAPGSLTSSEYFSIVAFDLTENGIDLKGQTLDASNVASVSVH